MNLNELQQLASRTLPPPGVNHWFLAPALFAEDKAAHAQRIDLIHAAFGIAGEAGELIDPIKKAMFYGKPLDVENIREELGDLVWYVAAAACRALGCTLEELATANIEKLRKRYPEKYTDEAAVVRADKAPAVVATNEHKDNAPGWPPVREGFAYVGCWASVHAQKYAGKIVDGGYYWEDETKSWQPIPEAWTTNQ